MLNPMDPKADLGPQRKERRGHRSIFLPRQHTRLLDTVSSSNQKSLLPKSEVQKLSQ